MIKFIGKNIKEIQESKALSLYGFFLSLTHLWTFFYWNQNQFFVNSQSSLNAEPLCFPFFPNCDLWRILIPDWGWTVILFAYLLLTMVCGVLFFDKKNIKFAYYFLLILTFFKLILHLSNYNFMGNYHYMIYGISFIYLFLSEKGKAIPISLVGFYFSAGILKLNIDWLSGAAMIKSPFLNGPLLTASLYYVIFLELIFIFGLIHKNRWVRLLTLIQLIAFHIFSWHIVGFFYPLVMFSLLSLLLINEYFVWTKVNRNTNLLNEFIKFKLPKNHYLLALLFVFLQAFPFLIAKDPSLSGAIRLSSLNMFDSKTECYPLLVAHRDNDSVQLERPMKTLGVRLQCDPLVFLNQAHQMCRKNKITRDFDHLSFSLLSKRVTQTTYRKVIDIKNICDSRFILWSEYLKGSFL